jgi:hypothetical protein
MAISVVSLFASFFSVATDLVAGSDGQITTVTFNSTNGVTTFDIYAAPGIGPDAGAVLACQIVTPILLRDGYTNARFFVLDRAGDGPRRGRAPACEL